MPEALIKRLLDRLNSLERTPESIPFVLSELFGPGGTTEIPKLVTVVDLYQWVFDYGILLKLLKDALPNWFDDAGNLKTDSGRADAYNALLEQLKLLNSTENIPGKNIKNPYKGKLDNLIKALIELDLDGVHDFIVSFVKKAQLDVETVSAFNELLNSVMFVLMQSEKAVLLKQLDSLGKGADGAFRIEGLSTPVVTAIRTADDRSNQFLQIRNSSVYNSWKSLFNGLAKLLAKKIDDINEQMIDEEIKKIKDQAADKLATDTDIIYLKDKDKKTQQEAINNSLVDYLNKFKRALLQWKKYAASLKEQPVYIVSVIKEVKAKKAGQVTPDISVKKKVTAVAQKVESAQPVQAQAQIPAHPSISGESGEVPEAPPVSGEVPTAPLAPGESDVPEAPPVD